MDRTSALTQDVSHLTSLVNGTLINCIHVLAYNSIISTLAGYWLAKTGDVSIEPKGALQVIKPKGALRVIHRLSRVILVRPRVCIACERFLKCSCSTLRYPHKSSQKLCLPLMLPTFPLLVRHIFTSYFSLLGLFYFLSHFPFPISNSPN